MRAVVAALLVAALAAGCDDNGQTYSRTDVERAFRSQGFELVAPTGEDSLLAPKNDPALFVVAIFPSERYVDNGIRTLMRDASSESFDAQEKNVLVVSNDGVSAPTQERIRDALDELD